MANKILPTFGKRLNYIWNPKVYTSLYGQDIRFGERDGDGLQYTDPYQEKSFYRNAEYPDYDDVALRSRSRGNYADAVVVNGEEYLVDHPKRGPHKGYGIVEIPNKGLFRVDYRSGKPELRRAPTVFKDGGIGDPIKANPARNQPFPSYYESNKEAFDAADQAARSYMTDWFDKRATLTNPDGTQKYTAAPYMSDYLKKSGQSVYIPQGGSLSKTGTGDAGGLASSPNYNLPMPGPGSSQRDVDYYNELGKNPFSYATEGMEKIREGLGRKASDLGNTQVNTAYYFANPDYQGNIVDYGTQPTTQLEEQLHLASNYGEFKDPTHKSLFTDKDITSAINAKNISKMGYAGMNGNEAYFGNTQEFYPRLMSARRTFGLDPAKEYSAEDMSKFLDEGYNKIIGNKYTEPGQKEHLIEFYKQLGYPTPSSQFMQNNPSQEQIDSAKKKAAENFRLTNEKFAMNDAEDKIFRGRKGGFPCYTCKSLKSEVTKKFNGKKK
jgi:hypothetical protein